MKFWIFKHAWDTTEKLFRSIRHDERVEYYGNISFIPKFNSIWFILTKQLKKKVYVPLKILKLPKKHSEKYCFVFLGGINISIGFSIIEKLKKRFINSKAVAYFTDINDLNRFNVDELNRFYDEVRIFDRKTANLLKVKYCPLPFDFPEHFDVVYIGQSKKRVLELKQLNDFFLRNGIKTFFYLADSKKNKLEHLDGITIGPIMSYEKMLMYLVSSNCILELKSSVTDAYTDRIQKAIVLNKKVITNNPSIINYEYYNPNLIKVFTDVKDIDVNFVKESVFLANYNYKGDYNPSHLLDLIEKDDLLNKSAKQ